MISIVIPTFNEIRNISEIINQLLILDFSSDLEIIIVDDNSSDGTADKVRQLVHNDKRIRLINRVGRTGLSSAIKEGCLCAMGELIIIMDTDGQHQVENITSAINIIQQGKYDLVTGSRFLDNSVLKGFICSSNLLVSSSPVHSGTAGIS